MLNNKHLCMADSYAIAAQLKINVGHMLNQEKSVSFTVKAPWSKSLYHITYEYNEDLRTGAITINERTVKFSLEDESEVGMTFAAIAFGLLTKDCPHTYLLYEGLSNEAKELGEYYPYGKD